MPTDPMTTWLNDETVPDPAAKTPSRWLYDAWLAWCLARGGVSPGGSGWFSRSLAERGFARYVNSYSKGFVGLRLRADGERLPAHRDQVATLIEMRESVAS
jgi:hypothetical protein